MSVIQTPAPPPPEPVGPSGPTAAEGVKKWKVYDDRGNVYTFRINPNQMTSPYMERTLNARRTTSPRGNWIVTEGERTPVTWSFRGDILTRPQYFSMKKWFGGKRRRLWIIDHFGRRITIVTQSFKPEPKRSLKHYWRHTYEVNALVLGIRHFE